MYLREKTVSFSHLNGADHFPKMPHKEKKINQIPPNSRSTEAYRTEMEEKS